MVQPLVVIILGQAVALFAVDVGQADSFTFGDARFGYVDGERPPVELFPMQGGDDGLGGFVRDFDEAEAAALVGLAVEADAGADHFGVRFDEFGQLSGTDVKR